MVALQGKIPAWSPGDVDFFCDGRLAATRTFRALKDFKDLWKKPTRTLASLNPYMKPAVPIARARSIYGVSCKPLQLQILQCCTRRNSTGGASDVDKCSMLQQMRVCRAEDAPAPAEAVAFVIDDAAFLSMQLCDERSRRIHLASVGHCNK